MIRMKKQANRRAIVISAALTLALLNETQSPDLTDCPVHGILRTVG
jgi:hypothetical protein